MRILMAAGGVVAGVVGLVAAVIGLDVYNDVYARRMRKLGRTADVKGWYD